jgi:hypothetical protein
MSKESRFGKENFNFKKVNYVEIKALIKENLKSIFCKSG